MSKIYNLGRHIFLSAALMTLLGAAAHTTHAQDIVQIRNALASGAGGFAFSFRGGTAPPEASLVVDNLNDSGSFTGKYYPYSGPVPSADNVSGTITIISGGAIRISFMVRADRVGGVSPATTFDGALLLGTGGHTSFMAGTYTFRGTIPSPGPRRAPGPYPFCAIFVPLPG